MFARNKSTGLHLQRLIQNLHILKLEERKLLLIPLKRKLPQHRKEKKKDLLQRIRFLTWQILNLIKQKTNTKTATMRKIKIMHTLTIKSMIIADMATHTDTEQNYCQKTEKSVRLQQYSSLWPLAHILSLKESP
jgi:hypothetical protein